MGFWLFRVRSGFYASGFVGFGISGRRVDVFLFLLVKFGGFRCLLSV